jgi:hypothetical protein
MHTGQKGNVRGEHSTDISAVYYYTDGDFLNATLWLFPFEVKPNYTMVSYGMLMDSDFDNDTGFLGLENQLEIRWDNNSRTWTRTLESWSPRGSQRTIDFRDNYTGFFEQDGGYVTLSLNLDQIGAPSKYKVLFYAEVQRDGISFTDFTTWVPIPQLQMIITTQPNSIEIHKGEEKTIEVKLNSSQGYEPAVKVHAESALNKVKIEFPQNDTLHIPTHGLATTPLTIRASQDAPEGPYTMFISANSILPQESPLSQTKLNEHGSLDNKTLTFFQVIAMTPQVGIGTQTSVLVTIQKPLTWVDQVSDFWNKVGNPISFIYGILAGISPWIYTRLRKRIKNDKQKNNNESNSIP